MHLIPEVIDMLACPHCGAPFSLAEKSVTCANGHAFDLARQGYVNLLVGGAPVSAGDTPEMVDARARFLEAGHYAPVSAAVAAAVGLAPAGVVADVGAGTGQHLAAVLDASGRTGIALDISKAAARRAARAHPRIGAVVCDAWSALPLRDCSVACILDIFSPRNPGEFHRVLSDGGIAVVVTPEPDHLAELVSALGLIGMEDDKAERLEAKMSPLFDRVATETVTGPMRLSHDEVAAVVGMGPSVRHLSADEVRAGIRALRAETEVTLSVRVTTFLRRADEPRRNGSPRTTGAPATS